MKKTSSLLVTFTVAATMALTATVDAVAQDAKPGMAADKPTELSSFLCKDIMRLHTEERSIAIGMMHGYFLGKKNATSYVSSVLGKVSDDFTEYCLDHPSEKAIDAFAKLVK